MAYTVRAEWSTFRLGQVQRTRLEKTLTLHLVPHEDRWHLHLQAQAPRLLGDNPSFFEEAGLLLAGLYADLLLELAPTGELLGLVHPVAAQTVWPPLRQELRHRYPAPSELLELLVAGVESQLVQPAGLAPSLAYDYLYAALPGNFYQQPFERTHHWVGTKVFPQFFDGLSLYFTETRRLAPATVPGQVVLHLSGAIDPVATDLASVARQLTPALGRPVDPTEVEFAYRATHCFDPLTGLPVAVALTVSATCPGQYRKEYHLTIEAAPAALTPPLP